MDRQVRRLGIAFVAIFGLLFAQLAYVQVVAADRIADNPANAFRQIVAEYKVDRGDILAADGRVLAESVKAGRKSTFLYRREYPAGPEYAAITGFYSRVYGRTGLEQAMNEYMSGAAPELAIANVTDLILGNPKKGGSVETPIIPALQLAAWDALGTNPGAIAVLRPGTGDVMAMVANPTFDPNRLSSGTSEEIADAWETYTSDPDNPLRSRAKDELYLPGSSFKMITASAALRAGHGPDSEWPNPRVLDLPLTNVNLENFEGSLCNGGSSTVTMAEAFQESCNVTFAEIGLDLGAKKMQAQAQRYGFCPTFPPEQTTCEEQTYAAVPADYPVTTGRFPQPAYFQRNDPLLAFSSIGLDNVLTNPLQLAMVGASVANGGEMMAPRFATEVRDPQGRVVATLDDQSLGHPLTNNQANNLREMMVSVVNGGTATSAFLGESVVVAGKTGTATNGPDEPPNAWFTAFAPASGDDVPRIAVAVIVLHGGTRLDDAATGGAVAAPIARQVIDACQQIELCWNPPREGE